MTGCNIRLDQVILSRFAALVRWVTFTLPYKIYRWSLHENSGTHVMAESML